MLIFKTENLIVRPLKNSDCANYTYQTVLCDNDELTAKAAVENKEFDLFTDYLKEIEFLMNLESYYIFGAFKKDTNELVGLLEIMLLESEDTLKANVGYEVFKQFQNNGYGTNMLKCSKQIAKVLDIEELLLYIGCDNLPSNRVAEKAAFTLKGFALSCTVRNKTFTNVNIYNLAII